MHGVGPGTDFEQMLSNYRDLATTTLLASIPAQGPPYLYELVAEYPARLGKGLRAALCLATCGALGGDEARALDAAVAIELFHNGFLIHDDVQDASLVRRGAPTLHQAYGPAIAINVGNATNLLAFQHILGNARSMGAEVSLAIAEETERMMRYSLEGQAIELSWIRDNDCGVASADYLRMCLKKTAWYSFIFPMRVGATVAQSSAVDRNRFCRFGWFFGAAFQIQDDILNLTGQYNKYGKELTGDLAEGKRTLMLIHLLAACTRRERRRLEEFLAKPRGARTRSEITAVHEQMVAYGSIDWSRRAARQLAGAALLEAVNAFRAVPDSPQKNFILQMVLYVVDRDR